MIKTFAFAFACTLLLASGLWSEELPSAPEPQTGNSAQNNMVAFEEPAPPPQRREQQALRTADAHYWAMAGLASGATVSNVELITRCSACTLVPGGIRGSRGALYGIGIPVAVAADYLGYRIKRNRSRTWVVPMAVVTALNIGYAIHAAHTTF